jgi:hypothetical protein
MWSNKEYMTYAERESSNKKGLIINFYDDNWIFVALIDKNQFITGETHYVCDDLVGLEEFLKDKKEYLINK